MIGEEEQSKPGRPGFDFWEAIVFHAAVNTGFAVEFQTAGS